MRAVVTNAPGDELRYQWVSYFPFRQQLNLPQELLVGKAINAANGVNKAEVSSRGFEVCELKASFCETIIDIKNCSFNNYFLFLKSVTIISPTTSHN